MAKRVCPRCAEFVDKKAEVCPFCGEVLIKKEDKLDDASALLFGSTNLDKSNELVESENKEIQPSQEISSEEALTLQVPENEVLLAAGAENEKPKRHKHKPKIKDLPNVTKDENGELDVDTSNIDLFAGPSLNYSEKKARGDGKEEKIAWWEIYKWGQKYLERKEVKKEVKKAGVIEPEYISHAKLLVLCLLFGWMGAHNFYAKNTKKGWFVLISIITAFVVMNIPAFVGKIDVFVTGGLGLIVLMMWIYDTINIILHRYQFRESRLKFISRLNLKSRKKLGKKYENISEWFTPYEDRINLRKNAKLRKQK